MTQEDSGGTHRAGLFDIRIIIASLIGLYGVILVVTGLFTSDTQVQRSDGLNINLYGGIAMILVGGAFAVWARVRPIIVPDDPEEVPHDQPGEQ